MVFTIFERPSGIAPFGGRHPSGCDDGVRDLLFGDFGPRWRLLGFVAQNPTMARWDRAMTTRSCQDEGARRRRRQKIGTVVPLGTVMPRMVLSVPIVAARVCHEVQFLLAARFRL